VAAGRAPRTAIGITADHRLFLVTVDGRQPHHSIGMTLWELAQFMVQLGCQEAVNLDGGGSTTFVVRGRVVNRPSDGRERPISNIIAVIENQATLTVAAGNSRS